MTALQNKLPRLKIINQTVNSGISNVQNIAVSLSTGKYLVFLDCDDMLEPCALSVMKQHITEHPTVDYFFLICER